MVMKPAQGYAVQCDYRGCNATGPMWDEPEHARELAIYNDWECTPDLDLCPEHVDATD